MTRPSFYLHRGPFNETTQNNPAFRFFEAYLEMAQDLKKIAASDSFVEWYSPSSSFVDRDGYVWKSPNGILAGMQKVLGWTNMRVEHNETKLLSGVVLLRPGVGVVDVIESFGGEQSTTFQGQREGDVIGDILLCEHTVSFTPLLRNGSIGKEISISRMIEFYDGPSEVEGQGTYGRQHWYGKVWWDTDVLKAEMKKMAEASK
jgi:hypothetical protein